jgi:hypothetical protein
MVKSELKRLINCDFNKVLSGYGFKFDTVREGFIKKTETGYEGVIISIVEYPGRCIASGCFLIRINEVENIVNKIIFVLPKYQTSTYTVNIPFERILDKSEFEIKDVADFEEFKKAFLDIFSFKINKLLSYNSNIEHLHDLINVQGSKLPYLETTGDYVRRIIISKIVNANNSEEIINKYIKEFRLRYKNDLEELEYLIKAKDYNIVS